MRYFVMGTPTDSRATAFVPTPALTPVASSYRAVRITGQPGTRGVPAPKPAALVPISQVPQTQRSNVVPDVIFPSIYIAHADNMHVPVSLFRDNQLPVPAVDLYRFPNNSKPTFTGRLANPTMRRRRIGGRHPLRWPASPQVWR